MTTHASAPAWLALLMTGFAGRPFRVQAMAAGATAPRPVLSEGHLLLPAEMLGNDTSDLARAAVAHAAAHVRHSLPHQPTDKLKPMTVAVVSALEDARVERLAMADMPGLRRWWAPFHADPPDEADLSFGGFVARLGSVLFHPGRSSGNYWIGKGRELFERQACTDLLDHEAFRRIGSVLANDLGQMRVRFEPQQYRVSPAYRDDNSYLWTHSERPEQEPPPAAGPRSDAGTGDAHPAGGAGRPPGRAAAATGRGRVGSLPPARVGPPPRPAAARLVHCRRDAATRLPTRRRADALVAAASTTLPRTTA